MTRIFEINGSGIVFEAELDNRGVPTISAKTTKIADKMAEKIGCAIVDAEGNFEHTIFHFNREITEVEAELLTNIFSKYFI